MCKECAVERKKRPTMALEETYEGDSKFTSTHSKSASGRSRGSSSRSRCRLQAKEIGVTAD